jgi:hypothetical protein
MTEGYEIHTLLRVATSVVQDAGLVFSGARADGRNIAFDIEGTEPDSREHSRVMFNLDLNRMLVDSEDLTMQQERALRGIAAWLDINFVELEDLEEEAA